MLAYNTQDLILEPFAGLVFGMTPGQSTQLGGLQHAGVFVGMIIVAVVGTWVGRSRVEVLQRWIIGGCVASGAALIGLGVSGAFPETWPLKTNVFVLGVANGAFAVAAIGAMMAMAHDGREGRSGTRVGLWGAAQAIAFALGGLFGTLAVDVARLITPSAAYAYGSVFLIEAVMFLVSAILAFAVSRDAAAAAHATGEPVGLAKAGG